MKRPHPNRWISMFIGLPEWPVKNRLRRFLAFSPLIPNFISDWSPLKGYERKYQLQPGDVVLDAGAYPGDYTLFAARKVGPSGRVIAFEPGEQNRKVLERNIAAEKLNNITIIPKGIWNENARLRMDQDGLASTVVLSDDSDSEIEVTTVDEVVEALGLSRVDLLKMDIEGAEIQAIEGCRRTLENFSVNVCIASYHIVDGTTTSHAMEKFLREQGYETESAYPRHLTTYGWKGAS